MHKKKAINEPQQRYCSYEDLCEMYGIGLTLARKFAQEHGLTVRIGRRVLIDLNKAEQALKATGTKEA